MIKGTQNCQGFSLLGFVVGLVFSSIVLVLGMQWQESNQRSQARVTLESSAASQMQEFFKNRRKSIKSVLPNGVISNSVADPRRDLIINRPRFDNQGVQLPDSSETITVNCSVPTIPFGNLPQSYVCPGLCPGGQVPTSITISIDGVRADIFPLGATPGTFPDGRGTNKLAASLCMRLSNNQVSLALTYLLRFDNSQVVELRTRTEIFSLPVPGGAPRPKIIGVGQ